MKNDDCIENGRLFCNSRYVSSIHSRSFEGMTEAESDPLLDHLNAVIESEEFQIRFSWYTGSMVVSQVQYFVLK